MPTPTFAPLTIMIMSKYEEVEYALNLLCNVRMHAKTGPP